MTVNLGENVQESDVVVVEGKGPDVTQPEKASEEKPEGVKPEGEDGQPEEKPNGPEHKENRVQKRIDKLTRDKYQLKGENDALKRQLDMLAGGQQSQPQAQSYKPTRGQFESDVEYIDALTDFNARQIREEIKQERGQEIVHGNLQQQIVEARKVHEDYDEALEDVQNIQVPHAVNDALTSSPFAAEILYELGKNIDKASALANMSVAAAIKEIGKIEATIEARKAQPKPAQKITNAPDPVKPVSSKGAAGKRNHIEHPEDYTVEEWRAAERKRIETLKKR